MKKTNKFISLVTLGWALLLIGIAIAEPKNGSSTSLGRLSTGSFTGNRIHDDLENNGMIVSHRLTGHSGMEWPAGEHKYSNFASGVWFAGKVDVDGVDERVGAASAELRSLAGRAPMTISAAGGGGMGELLDKLLEMVPEEFEAPVEEEGEDPTEAPAAETVVEASCWAAAPLLVSLVPLTEVETIPAGVATMAITAKSSIRVNPPSPRSILLIVFILLAPP